MGSAPKKKYRKWNSNDVAMCCMHCVRCYAVCFAAWLMKVHAYTTEWVLILFLIFQTRNQIKTVCSYRNIFGKWRRTQRTLTSIEINFIVVRLLRTFDAMMQNNTSIFYSTTKFSIVEKKNCKLAYVCVCVCVLIRPNSTSSYNIPKLKSDATNKGKNSLQISS